MSDRDTLISFGFGPERVAWALKATSNAGLQPALDFLSAHEDDPVPDLDAVQEAPSAPRGGDEEDEDADPRAIAAAAEGAEAKSIKCEECGKIFKNTALANFHAEKSGHQNFAESTEEIKPLTEEEKKIKLAELRAAMQEKRAIKAKQEAEEQKANEALRRKAGKDAGQIREELRVKEALKEAEAKKREKIEDAKAKAAIKAQIEQDKRERAERAAKEKAQREGREYTGSSSAGGSVAKAPAPAAAAAGGSAVKGKDYPETRLQIRMATGGTPYTTTMPSTSTLLEVAEFLAGQTLSVDVDSVKFTLTFPKKTFTPADMRKTLRDLGLTPSAVLIASNS